MSLLASSARSGLTETTHEGVVAAAGPDGEIIAWSGEIDRPFYLRSSAKPFQALVSRELGADLSPLQMALACSSHDGLPVHISIVEGMLSDVGLSETDLRCPASWPLSADAGRALARDGHAVPRAIWNNCSGKHAAWLRACAVNDWDFGTYLDPGHPVQRAVVSVVADLGGISVEPVGIDGCGAPVLRTTARAMARLFARLAVDTRLDEVFTSMHRYPILVSGPSNGDAAIAGVGNMVAKRGAEGCLGVAVKNGFGIAVKAWDGVQAAAEVGMVAALGELLPGHSHPSSLLASIGEHPTLGGGQPVGALEPRISLERG